MSPASNPTENPTARKTASVHPCDGCPRAYRAPDFVCLLGRRPPPVSFSQHSTRAGPWCAIPCRPSLGWPHTARSWAALSAYAGQVRACDLTYLALATGSDRLGGARGGEERDQSLGVVDLSRAGHDGGREHLGELDIRREASRVIYSLCRQYLADRYHRNAGATVGALSARVSTGDFQKVLGARL